MAYRGKVTGGQHLRRFLKQAKAVKHRMIEKVETGFFTTSRYPDGTPVTNVAAWNEFGTQDSDGNVMVPSRPFFRQANEEVKKDLRDVLRREVDPKEMIVDRRIGNMLGSVHQRAVQTSIRDIKKPPLAESTKAAKGSDNPLVDTGVLRTSVTHKVHE